MDANNYGGGHLVVHDSVFGRFVALSFSRAVGSGFGSSCRFPAQKLLVLSFSGALSVVNHINVYILGFILFDIFM